MINRLSTNHVTDNRVVRNSSHCAECWSKKSQFIKQKHKNKTLNYKETMLSYCLVCKKKKKKIQKIKMQKC